MASKKQWYSVVAATALAASFTMSGCGSSSSGGVGSSSSTSSVTSSTSSNASSSSAGPVIVRVSDAYVLEANVTAGSAQAIEVRNGNGTYEFNTSISGTLMAEGGANDIDGDGNATAADPKAPTLKAPEGYTNINPFTTMLVNGKTDLNTTYPVSAYHVTASGMQFDFDVVAMGAVDNNGTGDVDIAKETAKAALTLSGYAGDGTMSSSSVSSVSSAAASSAFNPFPAAARDCIEVFPGDCDNASSEASSEASSSSVSSGEGTAFAEIDACTTNACIELVVKHYMGDLNGYFGGEASSAVSSDASSSVGASSSAFNPFPAAEL